MLALCSYVAQIAIGLRVCLNCFTDRIKIRLKLHSAKTFGQFFRVTLEILAQHHLRLAARLLHGKGEDVGLNLVDALRLQMGLESFFEFADFVFGGGLSRTKPVNLFFDC